MSKNISDWLPGITLRLGYTFEMNGNQYVVTSSSDDNLEMTKQGRKDREFIQSVYDSESKENKSGS